jgi:hypothetical protein
VLSFAPSSFAKRQENNLKQRQPAPLQVFLIEPADHFVDALFGIHRLVTVGLIQLIADSLRDRAMSMMLCFIFRKEPLDSLLGLGKAIRGLTDIF